MTEPAECRPDNIWDRLRRRKVVQWGLVYVAGAWGLLQGLAYVTDTFHWPELFQQLTTIALLVGLPIILVLAWYHGDRGEQRVTRVEFAILTLLFLLGGGLFWRYQGLGTETPATKAELAASAPPAIEAGPSIAVLPFENRSKVEDEAYFVDGIHDDILTQLSKISALRVISRTSVERFRKTDLSLKQIAAQLGVNSILEGGVQRAGNRVRINVQLIDAGTDAHLWAETYDRELTAENIFAIQTELAAAIAGALKAALTPAEKARVAVVPTRNLAAWEAYQQGQQHVAIRTSEGLIEAEKYFQKAIELDPGFAQAYAGLATTLALQPDYGSAPREPTLQRAQAAADAALKLDPELSEAWASSGLIAGVREQYERAQQMHRRAIELNPNNALAYKFYGNALANGGRIDEGLQAFTRAASLDPLSAIVQFNLGDGLQQHGRFQEAAMHYRRGIEIEPAMPHPYAALGLLSAYAWNRFADAVPLVTRAVELDPDSPSYRPSLMILYLDLGDESQARAIISQAAQRWPDNADIVLSMAVIDLLRRDDAGAVRHAERSLALYPSSPGALRLLRNADLQRGKYDRALARYRQAYPGLFAPDAPVVDFSNYEVGVDLALVLQRRGDSARAKVLLDAAERAIGKLPRLGQYGFWVLDAQIHTLRGDKEKALAALREAERAGWRAGWWYGRDFDPSLASIRDEREFKAVFADIERDMARQRAELEARPKDAPLILLSNP